MSYRPFRTNRYVRYMASAGSTEGRRTRRSLRLSSMILVAAGLFGVGGVVYLIFTSGTSLVYVAGVDIPAYHQIVQADLRLAPVDRRKTPPDAYAADQRDVLVGRYTTTAVHQDKPFRAEELGPRLPLNSLRDSVLALPMTSETTLGGRLARGDLIDILLSANGSDDGARRPGQRIAGARVLDLTAGPNAAVVVEVTSTSVTQFVAVRGSSTLTVARTRAYSEP